MTLLSTWEVAQLLRDCAYNGVEHTGNLQIKRKCIVPGEIVWDDCECGQLAVSMQRQYPSRDFPVDEVDHQAECGQPWIVVPYIISLARCAPVPDQNGKAPSCTALEAAALQLDKDMRNIRRAVQCCLDTAYNSHSVEAWELGAQEINGPQGACVETTLQVLVGWTNDCGC